jgi:hypothetical protein
MNGHSLMLRKERCGKMNVVLKPEEAELAVHVVVRLCVEDAG